MKRNSMFAVVVVLIHTLRLGAQAPPNYEPFFIIDVEESEVSPGQAPKSKTTTYFTAAELPWVNSGVRTGSGLEEGFTSSHEDVDLEFQGKKVKGTKITFNREPKQFANISAAEVTFWVSKEVPTPSFPVNLKSGVLRVPAGCAKFDIVAHSKDDKRINDRERSKSVSASGAYKAAVTYKLGSKDYSAHDFIYALEGAGPKGSWTVTLADEMPGGVCAINVVGEVSGTLRVTKVTTAPPPKSPDVFPEERFAFAPPAGFVKMPQTEKGEIVRYSNAQGEFISISGVKLGKGGFKELKDQLLSQTDQKDQLLSQTDQPGAEWGVIGFSTYHHVAGHVTLDAVAERTKVHYIFTEHAGRGFSIGISALPEMTDDQVRSLLSGWRWISP